jgi:hypothetical protein
VNFVKIDAFLTDEVVVSDQVPVPNLHCEDVGIHVLWFLGVADGELHSVIEISHRTAGPVSVGLLRLASPHESTHVNVV